MLYAYYFLHSAFWGSFLVLTDTPAALRQVQALLEDFRQCVQSAGGAGGVQVVNYVL